MISEFLIHAFFFCRECRENPIFILYFPKKVPIYSYIFRIKFPIIVPIFFWLAPFKPDFTLWYQFPLSRFLCLTSSSSLIYDDLRYIEVSICNNNEASIVSYRITDNLLLS